jgi:RNA polymerase sigma-70 factor (family 1)
MNFNSTNETLLLSLKEKIADGDQNSFRQLFHLYSKKLTQFAFAIVKSNDAAREIVDEVFIKIWRNKSSITTIQNLTVYLYTAIKNTSLNYLSARARENMVESFDFFSVQLSDNNSPEKTLINSEMLKKINAAIDQLPPRCKMVFKLVREDGLSYKEVGAILNISPKTVDAQMMIAVKQVSEKVKMDFDYFPSRNIKKN